MCSKFHKNIYKFNYVLINVNKYKKISTLQKNSEYIIGIHIYSIFFQF